MSNYTLLKQRFEDTVFKNNAEKNQLKAIEKAYADMSRRATGHIPRMKEVCVQWLNEEIFVSPLMIEDFDAWHKDICGKMVGKLNDIKSGFGTIGRAQKVINMTFKYIACINDSCSQYAGDCHMTLDGYTLAWYKSFVMPWVKEQEDKEDINKVIEWSKINSYKDYLLIQRNIRRYLDQTQAYSVTIGKKTSKSISLPKIPFQAEFIVWEGEIVREKYNNMVKELEKYQSRSQGANAGKSKDAWIIENLFDDFLRDCCKKL